MLAQASQIQPVWIQLSVGGMFAIMILRVVFDFINRRELKRKNGGVSYIDRLNALERHLVPKINDLHDWHKPEDGEQTWKNRQMLELMKEIKEIAVNTTRLAERNQSLLERLLPVLTNLEKAMS